MSLDGQGWQGYLKLKTLIYFGEHLELSGRGQMISQVVVLKITKSIYLRYSLASLSYVRQRDIDFIYGEPLPLTIF